MTLAPEESGLPMVGRFALEKTYAGDAVGTGTGVMLSAGDPATGEAGYVVLEVDQSITYVVTPGSGLPDA